jgi:hypothetical protein
MEFKLFGLTMTVEVVIICMILGAILGGHLFCSCSRVGLIEGMQTISANIDYNMGTDVANSWTNKAINYADKMGYADAKTKHSQYKGTPVPLPEGQMAMFADNEFKPECCPSTYSSSTGCACMTQEQVSYINERGGNRTMAPAEY